MLSDYLIFIINEIVYLFFCSFLIVLRVQPCRFFHHHFSPPHPPLCPAFNPTHLWLCPCILYTCYLMTLSLLSPVTPTPLPSGYCQCIVFFFNVSSYILLACFLDQPPLTGEIIWYLSFNAWFISLSIMFSSSIHAIAKSRSSLFLPAA